MKVALVTGAGGWLGSELTSNLLNSGYCVKAVDLLETAALKQLKQQFPETLEIVIGNLTEISKWEQHLEKVDYLYHLAAKVHAKPKNQADIEAFYHINRDCTQQLFDKALEYGVGKTIFVSTVAVYGKHGNTLITIDTPRNPETPYGISKHEAEMYGQQLIKENNFALTIVQPVTVYGGQDQGNFKKMYRLAQKGLTVQFGNGQNQKTVIYYQDLIAMMQQIGELSETTGKTYICGTEVVSFKQITQKYKQTTKAISIVIPASLARLTSAIGIKLGRKATNIAENIQTLMIDNIYKTNNALNNYTKFDDWNVEGEYE